ncbi:MAG: glycoside hydrolase family 95 protein [Acidobacteria bacterium]|nr:glycoside hydrolase family 95 protein [Acidobacteriota bacterium]
MYHAEFVLLATRVSSLPFILPFCLLHSAASIIMEWRPETNRRSRSQHEAVVPGAIPGWDKGKDAWRPSQSYRTDKENPWCQALPLGNGRLGAMVFGGVGFELIQLNEETLRGGSPIDRNNRQASQYLPELRRLIFQGRPDEAAFLVSSKMLGIPPRAEDYQTLGGLWLDFPGLEKPTNYYRELDLDSGIVTVRYDVNGVTYTREAFVSTPDQVVVVHISGSRPRAITCDISLERPDEAHPEEARASSWAEPPNRLVLRGSRIKFFAIAEARCPGGSCGPGGRRAASSIRAIDYRLTRQMNLRCCFLRRPAGKVPTIRAGSRISNVKGSSIV